MDRTGWKILLTIACLIMAGGMMFGFRNVSASETEEMSVVTEAEPEPPPREFMSASRHSSMDTLMREVPAAMAVKLKETERELLPSEA